MTPSRNASGKDRGKALLLELDKVTFKNVQRTGLTLYQPRPTDVIIATVSKSGTTLLQNLVYQMVVACGGGPPYDSDGTNFTDISFECPWLDYGPAMGAPEGKTNPRIFKTHAPFDDYQPFMSKARFIYCIRSPHDLSGSFLDFTFDALMKNKITDKADREAVFHAFVDERYVSMSEKSVKNWYWQVKGWTEAPIPKRLVLFYEDMKNNLRGTARRVARFLDLAPLSSQALDIIEERCSLKWMLGNPRFYTSVETKVFGFPSLPKVLDKNRVGFNKIKLTEKEIRGISRNIQHYFGVGTYEELMDLLNKRQRQAHPEYEDDRVEKA